MASLTVTASTERWPISGAFTIARGSRTHVDLVVCEVSDGTHTGRGEGSPVYFEGETAELCVEAIEMRVKAAGPLTRDSLVDTMMEGAARNALDCALWDLEAKQAGRPLWALAGLPEPRPVLTAFTISLGEPAAMEAAARKAAAEFSLLKVKLDAEGIAERMAAVRKGAPEARLIVDANESWDDLDIEREAHGLATLGVELIEQPVSAGEEDMLLGIRSPIPFCADESCHTHEDLDRIAGRFQAVNVKLDKAGGLTEAMALAEKARLRGLELMVGCMLSTSLGIGPAQLLAQRARWADLDGFRLLARDRDDAFLVRNGCIVRD